MRDLVVPFARAHAAGGFAAFVTILTCAALTGGSINVMTGVLDPTTALTLPPGETLSLAAMRGAVSASVGFILTMTGFAGIFLTGQAISLALDGREREVALLRLAGARPRAVARLLSGEFTLLAGVAGAVGAVLGWPVGAAYAPILLDAMALGGSVNVTPRLWSIPVVIAASMLIAYLASRAPARRAAKADPAAAVSQVVDARRAMTARRWVAAAVLVAGTAAIAAVPVADGSNYASASVFLNLVALSALAALAPVLVPIVARVIGAPLAALSPGTGRLAVEHIRFAARRAASLAEPLLLGIGIPGGLLLLVLSFNHASSEGRSAAELAAQDATNVLGISVMAGGAVIMALAAMLMSALAGVRERRSEFEALRRLGTSRRQIVVAVGCETLLIIAVAGLALAGAIAVMWQRAWTMADMIGGHPYLPLGWLGGLFAGGALLQLVVALAGAMATLPRETRSPDGGARRHRPLTPALPASDA